MDPNDHRKANIESIIDETVRRGVLYSDLINENRYRRSPLGYVVVGLTLAARLINECGERGIEEVLSYTQNRET